MFKKYGMGFLALILAVAASAFTQQSSAPLVSDYWFPTDENGVLLSETISISGHTTQPCDGDGDFCARGFSQDEVINNGDGTITLKEEVDPVTDGEPALMQE